MGVCPNQTMELQDLINALARVLNVKPSQVQQWMDEENGEDAIAQHNSENLKKKFDEGHKKAAKIARKEIADALSSAFDVDITGTTAEEIASALKSGITPDVDLSEDAIKKTETYKNLVAENTRLQQDQNKEVEKRVKESLKEKEAEYKKGLREASRKAINSELELAAERWLTDNNAVLNEDPEKKRKQIRELVNKLRDVEIEKDDDGGYLISKEGKPLTNKDGHNATIQDQFREFDYLFRFQEVKERKSTGLDPKNPGGNPGNQAFQHFKGEVPKDEAGMNAIRMDYVNKKIDNAAYKEVEKAYNEATKTA